MFPYPQCFLLSQRLLLLFLGLLLKLIITHGNNGQDEVDEVERAQEDDEQEEQSEDQDDLATIRQLGYRNPDQIFEILTRWQSGPASCSTRPSIVRPMLMPHPPQFVLPARSRHDSAMPLAAASAVTLGVVDATGALAVSSNGAITDSAGDTITVAGASTLLAEDGAGARFDIALDEAGHDFTGAVTATGWKKSSPKPAPCAAASSTPNRPNRKYLRFIPIQALMLMGPMIHGGLLHHLHGDRNVARFLKHKGHGKGLAFLQRLFQFEQHDVIAARFEHHG